LLFLSAHLPRLAVPSPLQAAALVSAICEPLVQVQVGKLTRRLEAPTILCPAEDRGVLSLWLLPNDDLSLVWQGRATSAREQAASPSEEERTHHVSVWEELARFPASSVTSSDEPRKWASREKHYTQLLHELCSLADTETCWRCAPSP